MAIPDPRSPGARTPRPLLDQWWALFARGLLAIAFGTLALSWPGVTFVVLLAMFGAFSIADGIVSLIGSARDRSWGWPLVGGLLGIAVGILTIAWPGTAALALVIFIGAWAIVRGILDIALAIALRGALGYEWVLGLSGVISILFGYFIVIWPRAGVVAVVAYVAGYAMLTGSLLIAASLRQRRWRAALDRVAVIGAS
jgi:uncharacterized membrane protein HdeD (DUF308 family)